MPPRPPGYSPKSAAIRRLNVPAIIGWVVGLFVLLFVIFGGYFTVKPYQRVVVTRAGAFSYVAGPGFHVKLPFLDALTYYRIDLQQLTTQPLNTYTVDNQEVNATWVVQYQIPADQVQFIYTSIGDVETDLLSMIIDRSKIEIGKANVSSIADKRAALVASVRQIVQTEAERLYHVNVSDVQLNNLDYQQSYRDAQAAAAVVKTQIEQAQGLQNKAQIEADTAKIVAAGDANQAIETARGQAESVRLNAVAAAESTRLNAIAQAEAIRVKGEAEASAKELMAKALADNPMLVQYQIALDWSGNLPTSMYAGTPFPILQGVMPK